MSRRTAEASKAVRDAWKEEQERVRMGKGTRDWTQEQQKEILELGRAYYHSDDPNDIYDGKSFEGHHMKSVEAYPEFQGDSANIQFLSKPEHIEAHRGDYRNASNWYFDPVTHEFTDFGEGKYIPCTVINLSDPIKILTVDTSEIGTDAETKPEERSTTTSSKHSEEPPKEKTKESTAPKKKSEEPPPKPPKPSPTKTKPEPPKPKIEPPKKPGFISKMLGGAKTLWSDTVWPFIKEHPLETAGLILGGLKAGHDLKDAFSGDRSSERSSGVGTSDDYTSSVDRSTDFSDSDAEEIVEDIFADEEDDDCEDTSKGTHKSPCPHLRHVGERKFKTKDGYVYHDIGDVPVNGYDPTSIDSDEE